MSSFTDGEPYIISSRGPLDAITIGSDVELIDMASDMNWTGNGTEGDPIVISNLTIDTSGGYYGLLIGNTTLHIIIENCSFYNSTDGFPHSFPSSGLILYNLRSVTVSNSTFNFNTNGISIHSSEHVIVRDSTFYRNLRGVEMFYTNRSIVLNCTLDENTRDAVYLERSYENHIRSNLGLRNDPGIMLYYSQYNRISDNVMLYTSDEGVLLEYSNYNLVYENYVDGFGDGDGITLSQTSHDNIIWNNTIKDPQEYGILLMRALHNQFYSNSLLNCSLVIEETTNLREKSTHYNILIESNNTVNGKPLIYMRDEDLFGSMISPTCGQLILVNVSNGRIDKVFLSNATFGIWIFQSKNLSITNCSLENYIYHGIYIYDSEGIEIRDSTFFKCFYSVIFSYSKGVIVRGNDMSSCDTGIFIRALSDCLVTENTIFNMSNNGIRIDESKYNLTGNHISHCEIGITSPYNGHREVDNEIVGNSISNCQVGIDDIGKFTDVLYNNIRECDVSIRTGDESQYKVTIGKNQINTSFGDGILLKGNGVSVLENTIFAKNGYGIRISDGAGDVIEHNSMYYCSLVFDDFHRDIEWNTIGTGNEVNSLPILRLLDPSGIYDVDYNDLHFGQVLIYANYVDISNIHVANTTVGFYIDCNSATITDSSASECDIGMEIDNGVWIENSHFQENRVGLLAREGYYNGGVRGSQFKRNSLAIFNDGEDDFSIMNNIFKSNNISISTFNGGSCTIGGNRFHDGQGHALSLTSGRDVVRNNAFFNNNQQVVGGDQIYAVEGTTISGNYWSDHNGTYDLLTGVIEGEHPFDNTPVAYIPREIITSPEILGFDDEEGGLYLKFDHPGAYEHVIYRSPSGGELAEIGRASGDEDRYLDSTVSDLTNYSYMVQSITDLGVTFPSDPVSYLVDRTPPELEVLSPLNGSWFNDEEIHVSWNYSDTGIGGCEVYLLIDGDRPPLLPKNLSYNISGLEEGHHKVKLTVIDLYGNSVEKEVHFSIDRTEPFVEFSLPDEGQFFNRRDIFIQDRVWDENGISSIERYLDGELIEPDPTDGILRNVDEGDHELVITAFDLAGNSATARVNFTVDLTYPSVIAVAPAPPTIDVDVEFIAITFSEKMDPRMVRFTLNGREITFQDGLRHTFQVSTSLLEEGSEVNLSISGTDPAGNRLEEVWFLFTMGERLYKVEIRIRDSFDGTLIKSVLNVSMDGIGGPVVTVENGTILLYLPLGHHTFIISGGGYQEFRFEFDLNGDLEYELTLERTEEVDPDRGDDEFPYLLLIMFAVTILLILFFYIVPAKLSKKYSEEE